MFKSMDLESGGLGLIPTLPMNNRVTQVGSLPSVPLVSHL